MAIARYRSRFQLLNGSIHLSEKMAIKGHRFKSIMSSFADAVIILNSDSDVEWMNLAAEQLIGISMKIAAGRQISKFFPADSDVMRILAQAMESGVTRTDHDAKIVTHSGELISVGVTGRPLDEEDGAGAVIIIRDLTSLKALERFMALNDKMTELGALAVGIAHEIKNPLGGIRGAAQLIKKEVESDSSIECADLIISEVDRINRLVMDLLENNQPGDFPKEELNIYPVLDEVIRILRNIFDQKNISLQRVFDPSLPPVIGNADRLRQIFINIIKNALEACDKNGAVTLSVRLTWPAARTTSSTKGNRMVLVEVADDGPGLSEEVEAGLFTPFFSRKKSGVGLGLPMTMSLVKAHDGMLEIGNRKGTKGAVASIYLPYAR